MSASAPMTGEPVTTSEEPDVARRARSAEGAPSRTELLAAAVEEFADLGYDGTSVRRLARRLGVHHNHFPQRFGTKERLWYAAVDQAFEELAYDLLPVIAAEFPDEMTHLRVLLVRFVEATSGRPAILRIINREAVLGGARFDYIYETYIGPVFDDVRALLERLAGRGLVRTEAASVVLFFALNGVGGGPATFPHLTRRLGTDLDTGDPAARRRHAEESVRLLFEGLAVD